MWRNFSKPPPSPPPQVPPLSPGLRKTVWSDGRNKIGLTSWSVGMNAGKRGRILLDGSWNKWPVEKTTPPPPVLLNSIGRGHGKNTLSAAGPNNIISRPACIPLRRQYLEEKKKTLRERRWGGKKNKNGI